MNLNEAMNKYVDRGTHHQATEVFGRAEIEAGEGPDYVEGESPSVGRSGLSTALVVVVVLALFGVFVGAATSSRHTSASNEAQTAAAPDANTQASLDQERAEIKKSWDSFVAGEWVRYHGTAGAAGVSVPDGWVKPSPSQDNLRQAFVSGLPVFDKPDGTILGYDFASLGYIPAEMATRPGFDPKAARIAKFGCDPSTAGCVSTAR